MVSSNHDPQPQPSKAAAQVQEAGDDEVLSILNLTAPQNDDNNSNIREPSGDASFTVTRPSDSLSFLVNQRATDASNVASGNQASEIGSTTTPDVVGAPVPPSNGTASMALIPSIFSTSSNSADENANGRRNVPIDNNAGVFETTEFDEPSPPQTGPATRATSEASHQGDVALAVAERVASRSTSFVDFGDDVEDQIEDRAIQIARRVLNEIRMETVDAHEVTTVPAGDASATIATELIDQQSVPKSETQSNKDLSTSVQRRRIQLLLGVVAALVIVVIALVVILVTRDNTSSNAASPAQSSAPAPASKCSFCAGGGSSTYSFEQLRKIPVGSSPTFPTCGDIYLYQQTLSSTDSSCPVLQALAFFFYCGCQTVPARPKNASCTACPNGAIATGSLYCPKVDTVVTVVGSSLFYFENCAQLASTELQKYGCTCPRSNTTST